MDNAIYVSDWQGGELLYYAREAGREVRWQGPEHIPDRIGMPFGTIVDDQGRVYVNDRANHLVLRLGVENTADASYEHASAAEEFAFGWTEAGGAVNVFLFGPTRCSDGESCTVRRLTLNDTDVLVDEAFSEIGPELPPIVTWTGAVDPTQRQVYVANVASNEVRVFDESNVLLNQLSLAVPTEVPVRGSEGQDPRPYGYDGPRINRIAFTDDRLVVQWIASGLSADSYRFLVSLYDRSGREVGEPYPTDMQLVSAADGLVLFSSFNAENGGRVSLRRYRIMNN